MPRAAPTVGVAAVPLNVIVLVPWLEPKLLPLTVTDVPTGPPVGFTLVIAGGAVTAKRTPLLATPPTDTRTLPVVAPAGREQGFGVAPTVRSGGPAVKRYAAHSRYQRWDQNSCH